MNKEKVEPMVVDKNGNIYYSAIEYYKDINELKQRISKAIEYIEKQLEDTKKCLEYAREYHNLNDTEKYTRDFNLYTMLLYKLRGEDNE